MLRIENAVQLTRGELAHKVDISYFEKLQPYAKKVKQGDLFIAYNTDDIELAMKNGAHGILTTTDKNDDNQSTAWIKVRDIEKASFDLLKYELLNHKCDFIVCDKLVFEIAQTIIKQDNIVFLDKSKPQEFFEKLYISPITAVISFNEDLMQYLSSDEHKFFHTPRKHDFVVRKSTPLSCEILYNEVVNIPYPEIFLQYLKGAIELAKELGILAQIKHLPKLECFEPVFVSSNLTECDYGKSSQVIIFSNNTTNKILTDLADFITLNTSWGERFFAFPISRNECNPTHAIVYTYTDKSDILNLLEDEKFCYALISDISKDDIVKQKQNAQPSLFD